jgi:hypothetical protein
MTPIFHTLTPSYAAVMLQPGVYVPQHLYRARSSERQIYAASNQTFQKGDFFAHLQAELENKRLGWVNGCAKVNG